MYTKLLRPNHQEYACRSELTAVFIPVMTGERPAVTFGVTMTENEPVLQLPLTSQTLATAFMTSLTCSSGVLDEATSCRFKKTPLSLTHLVPVPNVWDDVGAIGQSNRHRDLAGQSIDVKRRRARAGERTLRVTRD